MDFLLTERLLFQGIRRRVGYHAPNSPRSSGFQIQFTLRSEQQRSQLVVAFSTDGPMVRKVDENMRSNMAIDTDHKAAGHLTR
jgi:hypothetical protein